MVHSGSREIARMFFCSDGRSHGNRIRTLRRKKLTQSACGSSLPLVDESNLSHITRLGIRSFIRIAQTHAESQFISFGEIHLHPSCFQESYIPEPCPKMPGIGHDGPQNRSNCPFSQTVVPEKAEKQTRLRPSKG